MYRALRDLVATGPLCHLTTYIGPDATFPVPRAPGYVVRYAAEKVGGNGPWAA